jgi:PAS domain S-box-containing protein
MFQLPIGAFARRSKQHHGRMHCGAKGNDDRQRVAQPGRAREQTMSVQAWPNQTKPLTALNAARKHVSEVLESITDAFLLLDPQWRLAYMNRQAEILLGRKHEELIGRVAWQAFADAVGTDVERELQRAIRERVTTKFETFYAPLQKWLFIAAYPSAEGLSVYFNDITERKRAESIVEEKESRFRAVFDHQYQFTALLAPDGTVEEINKLALKTTGFSRAQIIGHKLWETPIFASLPEMQQLWRDQLDRASRSRDRLVSTCQFATATGSIRVAEAGVTAVRNERNEIVFFIAEGKDITESRQAEEKLRQSELRFETLVSQVKEYAIFITDNDGRPTTWNEGVQRILHYSENEFVGMDPRTIYTPEDVAAHVPEQEFEHAAKHGAASDDRWLVRKGGERFWASGMTTGVRGTHGELVGFAKVFRDLTEQKRMQDELSETQHQLRLYAEQLEKRVVERTATLQQTISELEAFSYSVSHDLRAPLRAMQGYAQFLLEDYGKSVDETGRDFMVRIGEAAKRLDHLVQDILTYSRVARAEIQLAPVDLEKLIHQVTQVYPELQQSAKIEIHRPLLKVIAHEPSVTQCISNLLGNAVKFVPADRQAHIVVSTERRDGKVRVWFSDNGIGIAPEHQQRIFRMFETAHHAGGYEGTGIGLAIVRKAVERMGGNVGVESTPGKGSRFWIELQEAQ